MLTKFGINCKATDCTQKHAGNQKYKNYTGGVQRDSLLQQLDNSG